MCLIAPVRFPISQPYAGGLESHTAVLADQLSRRGHQVTLFAASGSEAPDGVELWPAPAFAGSVAARADLAAPPDQWMSEHHAYLDLMMTLAREAGDRFDVVHNNSLHHLPVAMAALLDVPLVTTLHTPPLPWLESAVRMSAHDASYVAVSAFAARAWAHALSAEVVLNGVDTDLWTRGPGGGAAVWSGRIVPEKAPHEAIDAARLAGLPLVLCGPVLDPDYARREVFPRLGGDVSYFGHLHHRQLRHVVRRARVAFVTPAWDEPYGLVAAEAMACGTPVAGYRKGALAEVVDADGGVLVEAGDVAGLADAALQAASLDRDRVRASAVARCSAEAMAEGYEDIYRDLVLDRLAS